MTTSQCLRKPPLSEYLSRDLGIAVFISISIHIFLAAVLWSGITRHIAIKPHAFRDKKPLILTLSTYTAPSHEIQEPEEIPVMLHTDLPDDLSESSQDQVPANELKPETDTVYLQENEVITELEASPIEVTETDQSLPTDPESVYNMANDFGKMPKFETDTVVRIKSQNVQVPEPLEEESSVTVAIPSLDLEAAYSTAHDYSFETGTVIKLKGIGELDSKTAGNYFRTDYFAPSFGMDNYFYLEELLGKPPDSKLRRRRLIARTHIIDDFKIEYPKRYINCKTTYTKGPLQGLFAIPLLFRDAVTGNRCKWIPVIE